MTQAFHVNQRLSYDGLLCTVRYIGHVKGTASEWLGVEWDDVDRGKHGGVHGGVKYFDCLSKSLTAASFVRPSRRTDSAQGFVEAVKHKYAPHLVSDIHNAGFDDADDAIVISGKEVEEVGFKKVRKQLANVKELRIVVVDTARIARPLATAINPERPSNPAVSDVSDSLPNVLELDLSRNLFETWGEIVDICRQLVRLTSLRVDGNRFSGLESGLSLHRLGAAPFTCIKTISLNDTLLEWESVAEIATSLPALSVLSASGNEYTELTKATLPPGLHHLHLERNRLQSLYSVAAVSNLQNLQSLSLRENPIRSVSNEQHLRDSPADFAFPKSLTDLDLAYCSISNWSLIDGLAQICRGLTSLRVSHNPLYENLVSADGMPLTPDDGYMLTVARLRRLTRLNFSSITPKERLNAELYYLAQINAELSVTAAEPRPQVIRSHPRYSELCQTYGLIREQKGDGTSPQVDPRSLTATLVTVRFKLDTSRAHGDPMRELCDRANVTGSITWDYEVPGSYNMYKIIGLVAKHYSLRPMSVQLELDNPNDETLPPFPGSDSPSDECDDDEVNGRIGRQPRLVHKSRQILVPLMRALNTWAEGTEATIRVCQR